MQVDASGCKWMQVDASGHRWTEVDTIWHNLTQLDALWHNLTQINLRSYAQILWLFEVGGETKLTAFVKANEADSQDKDFLYTEFPGHYNYQLKSRIDEQEKQLEESLQ